MFCFASKLIKSGLPVGISSNDIFWLSNLNKSLFDSYEVSNFSISSIWKKLINKDELYGFESLEDFRHLTDLNIYKQLLKN